MADIWSKLVERVPQRIGSLSLGQKVILTVGLASLMASVFVMLLWLKRPQYQVLYSHLASEDVGAVVDKLKEQRVAYRLADDGETILVPAEQVYETRMQLASQGLPQGGGVGFEIFDRGGLGTTEFVQKLNYKRALQGELARTIGQLAEVQQARVHLVMPEKSLFVQDQEEATASVVLRLKLGKELKSQQVQGIIHLVASSVDGLKPDRITVIDQRGRILSSGEKEAPFARLTSSQLEFRQSVEKDLERRIQSMLEQVVGPGKAIVRVSATLDFEQVERTEESYDPDKTVVRSEQRTGEVSTGSMPFPMGAPGVQSNLPAKAGEEAPSGGAVPSQYKKENEVINYEINKVVRRVVEPMGGVRQFSVAVLIDGKYKPAGDKGEKAGELEYIPRSPEELTGYQSLVKKAIGFSEERGDQVEVASFPFESTRLSWESPTAMGEGAARGLWDTVLKYGLGMVVLVLILLFVVRPLIRRLTSSDTLVVREGVPQTVAELEAQLLLSEGREVRQTTSSRERILQLTQADPVRTAQLIRAWLRETRS